MRRRALFVHVALIGTCCALRAQEAASDSVAIAQDVMVAAPLLVDRIIAIVDEEPILLSELEREIESYRFEAESRGRGHFGSRIVHQCR